MIITEKSKYLYSIEFKENDIKNEKLLRSLLQSKLLGPGTTITPNFKKINFNATRVVTLQNLLLEYEKERKIAKLDYNEAEQLIQSLTEQLTHLNKENYTFFNFTLKNIVVIEKNNKKIFVCLDQNYLLEIKNKQITFLEPFKMTEGFLSPDIKKLKELPSKAHYQSILYSLKHLVLFCIFSDMDYERKLEQIKYTNLYWKLLQL